MKVSIITPVGPRTTGEEFIQTAKTVYDQVGVERGTDYEWVVVYDGPDMAHSQAHGCYTKEVWLDQNYGPSVARNLGFQVSDGDVIAYVDAGDEIHPNRVNEILGAFEGDDDLQLAFWPYIIDEGKRFVYRPPPVDQVGDVVQKHNVMIPLGVAHRRWSFLQAGGFQPGIVCGEDGILWRRMIENMELLRYVGTKPEAKFASFCHGEAAGIYHVSLTGQSRTQRRFDAGGFAFDASDPKGSHGQHLDDEWYRLGHSRNAMDQKEGEDDGT